MNAMTTDWWNEIPTGRYRREEQLRRRKRNHNEKNPHTHEEILFFVELNKILKTDFNQNGIMERFDQSIKMEDKKKGKKGRRNENKTRSAQRTSTGEMTARVGMNLWAKLGCDGDGARMSELSRAGDVFRGTWTAGTRTHTTCARARRVSFHFFSRSLESPFIIFIFIHELYYFGMSF